MGNEFEELKRETRIKYFDDIRDPHIMYWKDVESIASEFHKLGVKEEESRIIQMIETFIVELIRKNQKNTNAYKRLTNAYRIESLIKLKSLLTAPQQEFCEWEYYPPEGSMCIGYNKTSCGKITHISTDTDFLGEFESIKFCPFCKKPKKVKEVK